MLNAYILTIGCYILTIGCYILAIGCYILAIDGYILVCEAKNLVIDGHILAIDEHNLVREARKLTREANFGTKYCYLNPPLTPPRRRIIRILSTPLLGGDYGVGKQKSRAKCSALKYKQLVSSLFIQLLT